MAFFVIGKYTYDAAVHENVPYYYMHSTLLDADADRSDLNNRVESYDHIMHQSLVKIFSEHCHNDSDQIKEFLRNPQHNTDYSSIIKPILEQEPFLRRHFSIKEFRKLSLLWIAVLCCYEKSAELLVRSGANVNEIFGRHDPQVVYEKSIILHILLQMETSPENERLVRLVIDHGAGLQARDHWGRNVLFHAVATDRVQITEILLEKGVDVNAAEETGLTPLLVAASRENSIKLSTLLMKYGADVFAIDHSGHNALYHSAAFYHTSVDLARVFIEKGVKLRNTENFSVKTTFHTAIVNGRHELVELFLDHGANVNIQNELGVSPLYLAAESCYGHNYGVVENLLVRGANIDLRTAEGRTPLHAACKKSAQFGSGEILFGDVEKIESIADTIELLLSAGADILAEDCDGNTPFDLISSGTLVEPPGTRLLIKELALKKALQPAIELEDEMIIEQHPRLLNYHRKCFKEIDTMKITRFIGSCTFFQLLAKNPCQIAKLMRNPKFEAKFKQDDLSDFKIFYKHLLCAFERAQMHYQLMLKLEDVINEAYRYTLPVLVVDKIVYYISHEQFNCCENVK